MVFNDDDLPPIDHSKNKWTDEQEITRTRPVEEKKPNKLKSNKGKRNRDESEEQQTPEEQHSEDEEPANEAAEPEPTPEITPSDWVEEKRKPKREKKKKRKLEDGDKDGEAEVDSDDIRKRHKSVFEKVQKALQSKDTDNKDEDDKKENEEDAEPEVEHGLEPIPQPEPVVFDGSNLTYETLPPWIASPVRVDPDTTRAFTELGIAPNSAKILESKGFKDAFAVQTAVLPLLLPSPDRQGDVVVAAPTGSGKTLSYVLPMVHDISKGVITKLRAVSVLPTRDLVHQVQAACEACAAAFAVNGGKRVKVGTAMGNKPFKEEQSVIVAAEQKYDLEGYNKYLQKRDRLVNLEDSDEEDDDLDLGRSQPLPYHVIDYVSKVDILICTPGRLVEHINKTRGFTMDYVRWLIVDEADKLLAQDFQQWLNTVMDKLAIAKPGARDFPGSNKTGVRKVILSATMTRDLSLLNGLKLSRPKLIVVEGTKAGEQSLPTTLKEYAIKVRDPALKPLYLVDLLNSKHMVAVNQDTASVESETSDSESSSSASSSDSEPDSDSDSDASSSSSSEDETRQPITNTPRLTKFPTTVLIFTKSNESTLRLSRLLALLCPSLSSLIGTLTSSTKTSRRARTLRQFAQGNIRVLVASDLVSRGIDLLNLEHVVNYDLPISQTGYVHRVGRTARAGRKGCAWSLVEWKEGRRFWGSFAGEEIKGRADDVDGENGGCRIVRGEGRKVERVRVGEEDGFGEERVREYERALEVLGKEAGR